MRRGGVRPRLLAPAGIACLLLVAFWPVVARRQTLFPVIPGVLPGAAARPSFLLDPMDTTWQNYPLALFVRHSWRDGNPPVWNGFSGCGEPLVPAGVGAATSPLRWWTALVEANPVLWDYFLLGRLALAGLLAFLFARKLGLGTAGAFTAGSAFMLSGHLVLNMNQAFLDAEVLLPALGLGVLGMCGPLSRRNSGKPLAVSHKPGKENGETGQDYSGKFTWPWAVTVLAGGAILLAGQPQSAFTAALLAAALEASGAVRSKHRLPALGGVASAGFVAFLLGAPFLFSFLDYLPRAQHVHGGQGMEPETLRGAASLVAPWLLGRFGERWLGLNAFRFLPYLGLSTVLLAVLGARRAWPRPAGPALALVPAFLLAAAYGIPPVSWLGHLPFLDSLWWGKYQGPTVLCVAVLAGFGVEAVVEVAGRRGWKKAALWLLPALVAGELFLLMPRQRPRPFNPMPADPYLVALRSGMDPLNERVWGTGRALMPHTGAALGIPDARTYFALYSRRAYWYLRGLVTGSVTTANEAVFTGSLRAYPALASPALRALAVRRVVALAEPGDLVPALAPAGDPMWMRAGDRGRTGRLVEPGSPPLRLALGIPPSGAVLAGMWTGAGGPADCAVSVEGRKLAVAGIPDRWKGFRVDLGDFGGSRAVVEFRASGGPGFLAGLLLRSPEGAVLGADGRRSGSAGRFKLISDGSVLVYDSPGALARARVAARALRANGDTGALYEASGDPANGRTVFVEAAANWAGFSARARPGPARVVSDSGWRVACEVPGGGVRVLVLADTWEPGWRAYAGKYRLAVRPADCMFRAVAVPPGEGEVRFFYEPLPFKFGLLSAGLGMGLLVGMSLGVLLFHSGGKPPTVHKRRRGRN